MSLTTSNQNEHISKIDDEGKSYPRLSANNQPRTSVYNRSFGRELSNFDSKNESILDGSKNNAQTVQNHKENFSTGLRPSVTNEAGLEKISNKQPQRKEIERIKEQPAKVSPTNRSAAEEEAEQQELDAFDNEKSSNPQFVTDYVKEVYEHLRETESKYMVQHGYITKSQQDINEKMRAILVDWLVDVHLKFKLLPETLFLTVNLIDRYLDQVPVSRQKLQLVGVGAMLIAAKYEEIYPPEVKEFEYVTDKAYNKAEILDMEGRILGCLNFNLTTPSSLKFLERYAMLAQTDEKMLNMAKYLLELALVEYKMLKYSPSNIACSAIYLINKINKREGWSSIMAKQTKYAETQLRPCAKDLCMLLQNVGKSSMQAVRRKFSSSKYTQASKIQLDKA
jgi:cyclin B